MAGRKKSTPSEKKPGKTGPPLIDDLYKFPTDEEAAEQFITNVPAHLATDAKKLKGLPKIEAKWESVLKASELGYEITAICKALGLHRKIMYDYLKKYPERRRELINAQNKPRDECVNAVLTAARKGVWVAAAWFLERTRGMEFAKPEVKLQWWDRMVSNDSVEQKISGKSIMEIRAELSQQIKDPQDGQREHLGAFQPNQNGQETGGTVTSLDLVADEGSEGSSSGL